MVDGFGWGWMIALLKLGHTCIMILLRVGSREKYDMDYLTELV
jgi:hypothetical protein